MIDKEREKMIEKDDSTVKTEQEDSKDIEIRYVLDLVDLMIEAESMSGGRSSLEIYGTHTRKICINFEFQTDEASYSDCIDIDLSRYSSLDVRKKAREKLSIIEAKSTMFLKSDYEFEEAE